MQESADWKRVFLLRLFNCLLRERVLLRFLVARMENFVDGAAKVLFDIALCFVQHAKHVERHCQVLNEINYKLL